jgi:uncharacterized protein YndB with AHSA1/START domain
MSISTEATTHELRRRDIAAGEARCAVFRRTYDAAIEDVWEACTDPDRLARWYQPVEGDLQVGGVFRQGDFGTGQVLECEAPRLLRVGVGNGEVWPDEITLRLSETEGRTVLEFEHATTLDSHEIGGQIYDAVYCMGGGYGPRLVSLELYLRGELPADVDVHALHERPEFRPAVNASLGALQALLDADH